MAGQQMKELEGERAGSGAASAPPGDVMPIIAVDSVDSARSFYVDTLGFGHQMGMLGKDGQLDFCTVTLGRARIMFSRQDEAVRVAPSAEKRPVQIYLEVADVKAHHHELKMRGVKIVAPLTMQWWGDLTFIVQDPFGYHVWFYQSVGEMKPPPGAKLV